MADSWFDNAQVETLRELIRVKIQDGADVDTAAVTLKCSTLLESLFIYFSFSLSRSMRNYPGHRIF